MRPRVRPRSGHRCGFTLIEVLVVIAIVGILVGLLVPAVQMARESARRTQCGNNFKQIGLALLQYHDTQGSLPPAFLTSKQGQPLLSWRVGILPFVEQKNLYDQFRLDEAWNSASNSPSTSMMPAIYACPSSADHQPGQTYSQVFVGSRSAFQATKGVSLQKFLDGPSNTILVAESRSSVTWSQPVDLTFGSDPNSLLQQVGGSRHPGVFHAVFGDGSVRLLKDTISPKDLAAMITRMGGEVVSSP